MASITIRNLDENSKQALRELAASNGRSMEEEARLLLDGLSARQAIPSNQSQNLSPQKLDVQSFPTQFQQNLAGKSILLIISGGIAAYKALELIRRLRDCNATVRPVMTKAAQEFITPLSVGALANDIVFTDLFDREAEHDIGHIRLSREADIILIAPASADLMAKMANGLADDLASTVLLANNKPILIAPAMNPAMWAHPATRRNHDILCSDGVKFIGPSSGEMAESGEAGIGRMAEPIEILYSIAQHFSSQTLIKLPLQGKRAIVTSGPTHEPIDPVRYIANRSSGKQGHAIAKALADAGAEVTLVSGPVNLTPPTNVKTINVQTAREMQEQVEHTLPADIAVMVAAVADWRSALNSEEKMKKQDGKTLSSLKLVENPDILKGIGEHPQRPKLLIGFAAETEKLKKHASEKLERKGCDWIVANDVSPEGNVMGGDENTVNIISLDGIETWPKMNKNLVATKLVEKIADHFATEKANV